MLEYNEILPKEYIVLDGEPYEVLASHVFRKQMRKPVNQTKLKSLTTGKVIERSFGQAEKAEEADVRKRAVTYLYAHRGESWFCEKGNPGARFSIKKDLIAHQLQYLKGNTDVDMLMFVRDDETEQMVGIQIPVKIDLKIKEAPPNVKGDTAQGGNKHAVLETGAVVSVPLFIEEGDVVRINTASGEYVERVSKR